jgi:2,4-dienoyl-CoA reductase-like NADH-dependent reductase (Old Yellow Enzyme family)
MTDLFAPLEFPRGPAARNAFMLAPLTNCQSHPDGVLSDDEHRWLAMRGEGGFGAVMTCAASVSPGGIGFPGQLGVHDDAHLPGLTRLADDLRASGAVSLVQLHHAGVRSPSELIGGAQPVGPSDHTDTGARAMTANEVQQVIDDFVAAARRSEQAGFDGVELHGAHGYLLCAFLSPELNQRTDAYGGSLEHRCRIVFEIIDGIRATCGPDFLVGVRLSLERFGVRLDEMRVLTQALIDTGDVDFIDLSLWDCFKEPVDMEGSGRTLLDVTTDLARRHDPQGRRVPVGVAGKLHTPDDVRRAIDGGADFVLLGRVAIAHHDYPARLQADPGWQPEQFPLPAEHYLAEGVSPSFVAYLRRSFARLLQE